MTQFVDILGYERIAALASALPFAPRRCGCARPTQRGPPGRSGTPAHLVGERAQLDADGLEGACRRARDRRSQRDADELRPVRGAGSCSRGTVHTGLPRTGRPHVRQLRREHHPAAVQAVLVGDGAQAGAADRADDRRPAQREGHRLGVVLRRLVERQRRRRRAWRVPIESTQSPSRAAGARRSPSRLRR